ncbi:MAG: ATP synthase F0 subunit C [Armatimonadota bacterium]
MLYLFGLVLATGFILALPAFAGALAQARAIAAAMEGTARQPESAGRLMVLMILGLAFIESLTIYAFVIALQLAGRLPETKAILEMLGAGR